MIPTEEEANLQRCHGFPMTNWMLTPHDESFENSQQFFYYSKQSQNRINRRHRLRDANASSSLLNRARKNVEKIKRNTTRADQGDCEGMVIQSALLLCIIELSHWLSVGVRRWTIPDKSRTRHRRRCNPILPDSE